MIEALDPGAPGVVVVSLRALFVVSNRMESCLLGRRSVATSGRKTKVHLERVVDQPLEGRQSANHTDTHRQTVPQSAETNVGVDPADRRARALAGLTISVQLRHHHVGRVRDDGAADTGDVATQERHTGLLQSVVRFLGLAELRVDLRDGALESRELDHGVRNLAGPERVEALVQPAEAFLGDDLGPAFAEVVGVGREGGLHADFDGFEGAEEDVGDEFCGGGGAEVDDCLGGVGEELLAVVVFEDFVGAVFTCALKGVADEGWGLAMLV